MTAIYHYLHTHRFVLWSIMLATFVLFVTLGIRCNLTEDISSLLPKGSNPAMDITFKKLKVKDKIFVNIEPVTTDEEADTDIQEAAMSDFLDRVQALDSNDHYIESVLYGIEPIELADAAYEIAAHLPAYLDLNEAELDSLTGKEHIRKTIAQYSQAIDTDEGAALFDLMGYDPCGIVLSQAQSHRSILANAKPDKTTAYITPSIGTTQSREAARLMRHMSQAKEEIEATYPGVRVLYHGQVVNSAGNGSRIRKDLMTTIAISLALAILLLGLCFGKVRYIGLLLLPILYGMAMAMAVIYLVHGSMSLMALGIGAIVLGVALSYAMHVLIHYLYTGNAEDTVRRQTKPVLMGSITTIGAFAGLLMTESPLLQDFGLFALLTVAGTTLASLIWMPQFFPIQYEPNRKAFNLLERLNATQIDRRWWLVAAVAAVTAITISQCNRYEFDTDLLHIGYISDETRLAQQCWQQKVHHGQKQQYYAAMSTDMDSALLYLEAIEKECAHLQQEGQIASYTPTSVLMPSIERQEERIRLWQEYFSPERSAKVWRNIEAACQAEGVEAGWFDAFRTLMDEPIEAELIAETDLIPSILQENMVEKVGDRYLVFLPVNMDSTQLTNQATIKDRLTAIEGCVVLDPFYYATSLVELAHTDFNRIMMISSIFVLLLLLGTYRNLWVALIAYMPVLLSWYAVLGAMAITGETFNILNIVVSSFVFGIGVDYSIFIMDGLLHGREDERLLIMHKTAITLSAAVLIMCMSSLLFAVHPAIHSIAFCSLFGMITTMMLSYTIQPNLYRLYQHIRQKRHGGK